MGGDGVMADTKEGEEKKETSNVKDAVKKEVSIYWWKKVIDFLVKKWF